VVDGPSVVNVATKEMVRVRHRTIGSLMITEEAGTTVSFRYRAKTARLVSDQMEVILSFALAPYIKQLLFSDL
jgi:hypothetical protein